MVAEEPDAQLRRIVRNAAAVVVLGIVAAAVSGSGMRGALGVAAGGLIVAVSYRGIRAGVDAMTKGAAAGQDPSPSTSVTWSLVKFITRFAMLGGIAYVMMVRLRAHPGWMLAGASSIVAAAAFEAVRGARRARP